MYDVHTVQVVYMLYMQGMSYRDICKKTGVSETTLSRWAQEKKWHRDKSARNYSSNKVELVKRLWCGGYSIRDIQTMSGVARRTIYRWAKMNDWPKRGSKKINKTWQETTNREYIK